MSTAAYVAFDADRRIAAGDLSEVARAAKSLLEFRKEARILVLDGSTSAPVEIDFRGTVDDVLARLPQAEAPPPAGVPDGELAPRGPGRPKLGVVAREVTLLPRHWEWLSQQRGGASVAIRRLVEEARRASEDTDRIRSAQESAFRFMSVMAGNRPNYEEAIRALFAHDRNRFTHLIGEWPTDIRDHAALLAGRAFRPDGQHIRG